MEKTLVDTSIIIDFLRRKDKSNSLFYKIFSQKEYKPVISLVTVTELWAGKSLKKKEALEFVKDLIEKCEVIFSDLETAKKAGEILREANYQISFQDASIAALALREDLPLLTLNEKDFKKIKKIKFLRI